jgi:transcriptional regulator with XRE-family HTH domain
MTAIGEQIKRLRKARGFTQESLAEASGVSRMTVARIEQAVSGPNVSTLDRFASALGGAP